MRESQERNRDLQWLELDSTATVEDVEEAYQRLLRRYGAGQLASYGLFRSVERQKFLAALKEAFSRLSRDG